LSAIWPPVKGAAVTFTNRHGRGSGTVIDRFGDRWWVETDEVKLSLAELDRPPGRPERYG
jgi:hypothetical protein